MDTPKEVLDKYIQENISPIMKNNGFSKYGKTWSKESDGITYIFNVQSNKWNAKGQPVEIYINYGIYSPINFKRQFKLSEPPSRPMDYDCATRLRLNRSDEMERWTIDLNGIERSGRLVDAIEKQVFPYFDSITNQEELDLQIYKFLR